MAEVRTLWHLSCKQIKEYLDYYRCRLCKYKVDGKIIYCLTYKRTNAEIVFSSIHSLGNLLEMIEDTGINYKEVQ